MIGNTRARRYLLSTLSGLLLVLAFPYTGSLFFLSFVALVPLLLVEDVISRNKYRSGKVFWHAYLTFFIYNAGSTWWIWYASEAGAFLAFFLNSLIMAFVFMAYHYTKKFVGHKEGYLSLIFYWVAFEFIHYNWELSWPWLNFGNVFSRVPEIAQWYSYTGVLGGTAWILLLNLVIYRIFQNVLLKRETWRVQTPILYTSLLLLLLPVGTSLWMYFSYTERGKTSEVVAVQPNLDPYEVKFNVPVEEQVREILDLAEQKVGPETEFVVAPETALWQSFYEEDFRGLALYKNLTDYRDRWAGTSLFIGASTLRFFKKFHSRASRPYHDGPGYFESYNTSMLLDANNNVRFVHKSKLVLGVEKIPFSNYMPFLEKLAIDLDGGSGTLGIEDEPKIMRTSKTVFAPVVCYESIYGGFVAEQCRKGAQLIFIITNDGWWKDTPGYKQHMSFARLRAIENRRDVARSANTGVSCFINQRGDVIQKTGWWEKAVIKGKLRKNGNKTFYTRYGDVTGRSFTFVAVLLLIYMLARRFMKLSGIRPKGTKAP